MYSSQLYVVTLFNLVVTNFLPFFTLSIVAILLRQSALPNLIVSPAALPLWPNLLFFYFCLLFSKFLQNITLGENYIIMH